MDWFTLLKHQFSHATTRSFQSFIKLEEDVLTYIFFKYLHSYNILPIHFLWTVNFFAIYPTYDVGAMIWNVSCETYTNKIKEIIGILFQEIDEINCKVTEHFILSSNTNVSFLLDTTECRIQKPQQRHIQHYLFSGHKQIASLKYQIILHPNSGLIRNIDGPFRGPKNDNSILYDTYNCWAVIEPQEKGIGDNQYISWTFIITPSKVRDSTDDEEQQAIKDKRGLTERVIGRIKAFQILEGPFRSSDFEFHQQIFLVICNIVNVWVKLHPM